MARGRKPAENPRDVVITLRLTQEEYRYLQGLSMKHGRPLGEIVRSLSLAGMPRETPAPPETPAPDGEERVDRSLARHPRGG